jgi:hypothetical protein
MNDRPVDTQADRDFLAQLYGFAERKAVNGVYIANITPRGLSQRACVIVALGAQADYVNNLLMNAASKEVFDDIRQRFNF